MGACSVTELSDSGNDVVFGGVEDVVGAELLCEVFSSGGDFGNDYQAGFAGFEGLDQLGRDDELCVQQEAGWI